MKNKMKKTTLVSGCTLFAVLVSAGPAAFGEKVYELEIVARKGVAVGKGTPIALGKAPSINDAGKVSFIARDTDATHGRVMTLNNGKVEQDCFIGTIASVADEVQINDHDQVIFRRRTDDGLFSDVIRLDGPCSG